MLGYNLHLFGAIVYIHISLDIGFLKLSLRSARVRLLSYFKIEGYKLLN